MSRKRKAPRMRGLVLFLLTLVTLAAGVLAPSATPEPRRLEVIAQITPSPTVEPTQAPMLPSAQPPTQAPQPAQTNKPIVLGEGAGQPSPEGGVTFVLQADVETAPMPETVYTMPPDALPTVQTTMPTAMPTPLPGPTPTTSYTSEDGIRIEVTRHSVKNVIYFAAEVWLTDIKQLRSAFSSDVFDGATEQVSDIAERNRAVLAINGDFATFNNGGIIIRNGEVYRTNRSTRQLLLIDSNGDFIPHIDPPERAEEAAEDFLAQGIWHTLVFGPVLVDDGEAVPLPEKFFINTRAVEPRTAIAQLGPLHYLLLVVDGRQDGYSQGVSLSRLQELLLDHGAVTAFNLDGGGSSTLYFQGNVLNKPANGDERRVPDILYIEGP